MMSAMMSCQDEEKQARITRENKEAERKADSAAMKIAVLPTMECLPIVVAKELRLFDTLNVDVRLKKYTSLSECRKALKNKTVEGADTFMTFTLLTAKKARLSRISQLSDKIIAADRFGLSKDIAAAVIDSLLKRKEHVFIVQVEDLNVRFDMLRNGNVDAALLPEPYATKARQLGAKELSITKYYKDTTKVTDRGAVFRKDVMKHPDRQKQKKLFNQALQAANDSIKQYGADTYIRRFLTW
jgi:NitT/TauT family transport system substrate-binding protein